MFTEELWLGEQDKRLVMGEALCAWAPAKPDMRRRLD